LLMKLGISVRQLAKDKEEDLRKLYSCWWSKPLPEHLSFRKILCFEGGGRSNRSVGQVVGDVFRCLVPILANNEGKVIMPILASGDQVL
ncbi:LINE-1 retrotransposable element ORF2, partial [Paramuricea clavata]